MPNVQGLAMYSRQRRTNGAMAASGLPSLTFVVDPRIGAIEGVHIPALLPYNGYGTT